MKSVLNHTAPVITVVGYQIAIWFCLSLKQTMGTGNKASNSLRANPLTRLLSYYFAQPGVFLNRCLLCCVDTLGVILPPSISPVAHSSVTLSFGPPEGASPSKVVVYIIKYRKVGSSFWKSTTEWTSWHQTVTGLEADSQYEFKVVARYRGESSTVESSSVTAKTKASKCTLLNFASISMIDRMHCSHLSRGLIVYICLSVYKRLGGSPNLL